MSALRDRLQSALGSAYRIDRELGGGGMSHVFVARDSALGRDIVVKVLPEDAAASLSVDRFKREIMLAARLQHPHVVPVLSAGEMDGLPYYTMPFVEGESLRDRLGREGELPVVEAVSILREVARALAYAHERGIVHRDIKPDNVMLSGGAAMVTDFGVAKAVSASSTNGGLTTLTQLGVALGTPAYIAPEQAAAEPTVDHRADLYAFGCMAYEMLSGQPPFAGRPAPALLAAHVAEAPEPLARRRPSVPPSLAALVMQCLEKRPADRPRSAADVLRALDGVVVTPMATAYLAPPERLPTMRRWTRAVPWLVAAAAVALSAGAIWRDDGDTGVPAMRLALPLSDSLRPALSEIVLLGGDSLVVYSGGRNSPGPIMLASLASGKASVLPGTDGGHALAASPDGSSIAFVAAGQLHRMRLPAGPVTALAPAKNVHYTAWLTDGTILLAEDEANIITAVSERGGAKDTLRLPLDRTPVGVSELPDGRALFSVGGFGFKVIDVRSARARTLTLDGPIDSVLAGYSERIPRGARVRWVASGHLAWVRNRRLMVAPFDVRTLRFTGPAMPIVDSVYSFAIGAHGTLVVARGLDVRDGYMVIAERSGRRDTIPQPLAQYRTFDVSLDGRRVAVSVGGSQLRILDLTDGTARNWPVADGSFYHEPRWSPDGRRLVFYTERITGEHALVLIDPDRADHADTIFRGDFTPHAWRPDGEIAGSVRKPGAYGTLARFRPEVDSAPREILRLHANEWYQSFAPNGRWYVFRSVGFTPEASGTYLAEDRPGAIPTRIGPESEAAWSPDGRSIVAVDGSSFVEYPVSWEGDRPRIGRATRLFDVPRLIDVPGHNLRVLRDGRIVFVEGQPVPWLRSFSVFTNWMREYRRAAVSEGP
jgi:serine/threonine-protein kinase